MDYTQDQLNAQIERIKLMGIKLPEPFKSDWMKALRSGEYKQGQGRLALKRDNADATGYVIEHCCLGVAADVCKVDLFTDQSLHSYGILTSNQENSNKWFDSVPEELRENQKLQEILYSLNDGYKQSFEQIADVIEQYL